MRPPLHWAVRKAGVTVPGQAAGLQIWLPLNTINPAWRTSLVVQWLGICAFTAGVMGSIPGQGTKIPHAALCSQKKKPPNPIWKKTAVRQPSVEEKLSQLNQLTVQARERQSQLNRREVLETELSEILGEARSHWCGLLQFLLSTRMGTSDFQRSPEQATHLSPLPGSGRY